MGKRNTKEIISRENTVRYEINTGTIYAELTGADERKWKNYERHFLEDVVWEALESTLWRKDIVTVKYDGKNGKYLENYRVASHLIIPQSYNALQTKRLIFSGNRN